MICVSICLFTNILVSNLKNDPNSTEDQITEANKISTLIYIITPVISIIIISISIYWGWSKTFNRQQYYNNYYDENPAERSPLLNDVVRYPVF